MVIRTIETPYLIFIGDIVERLGVKTGLGIMEWRGERCAGQYRLTPDAVNLGLPDMNPAVAAAAGVRTMVIGGASFGGALPPEWVGAVLAAIDAGLDVASGLHDRLADHPEIAARAAARGTMLHDVRGLPPGARSAVGSGRRRSGRRALMVGADCAVGKKFTALSLERDAHARGINATFRATGQTGVLISGGGVAIDAVVADFLSGVVEELSPDAAPDHWDIIEGQGSLLHPAYAAVSLGLLHGSQPDAIVLCHEAGRETLIGYPDYPIQPLDHCIDVHLVNGRLTNPDIRCVGISLNTSALSSEARARAIGSIEQRLGLPCVDPAVTGTGPIIAALQKIDH
jgi:uncharacterized NAD-dependent epimerase/dehydratase family protein